MIEYMQTLNYDVDLLCFTEKKNTKVINPQKLNKIYRKSSSDNDSYGEGLKLLANDFNRHDLARRMLDLIKSFL